MRRPGSGVDDLAAAAAAALPPLDGAQRLVGLAVYRAMAEGLPATPARLAGLSGLPLAVVAEVVAGLPTATVEAGAVIAFLGLQVTPGHHRLAFGNVVLGTWCAWDTLFLPELVGRVGTATSVCPVTGDPVTVVVDPVCGVRHAVPAGARLTFVARPRPYGDDLAVGFCRWIHFVRDDEAGAAWIAGHDGAGRSADAPELTVLSLADGVALGRRTNALLFGRD